MNGRGEISFCPLCRTRRNQAGADGVERGLRAALHAQFREDSAHVRFDGLLGIIQAARDLLVGLALRQQPQHLGLALGERLGTLRGAHGLHQARRRFGRQPHLPGCRRFDGLAERLVQHPLLQGGYFMTLGDDGSSAFCYRQSDSVPFSYTVHAPLARADSTAGHNH